MTFHPISSSSSSSWHLCATLIFSFYTSLTPPAFPRFSALRVLVHFHGEGGGATSDLFPVGGRVISPVCLANYLCRRGCVNKIERRCPREMRDRILKNRGRKVETVRRAMKIRALVIIKRSSRAERRASIKFETDAARSPRRRCNGNPLKFPKVHTVSLINGL